MEGVFMPDYRQVQCPHCGQQLRLTVLEKNFGKEVEVTCSECGNKFQTTISYPVADEELPHKIDKNDIRRLQPLMEEFGEALGEAITTNLRLKDAIEKIRQAGYDPFVRLEATMGFSKCEIREPKPLVQNGEVIRGAFDTEDSKWMSALKIKLDDE
jgi:uncharacterized Zn-finger protein